MQEHPIPKSARQRLLELPIGASEDFSLEECSQQAVRNAANHIGRREARHFVIRTLKDGDRTQLIRVWRTN